MTTTSAPPRAWRAVLDRVEQDLLAGRIGPGDRLPPERDLAAQLGVGRSTVREALRVLEVLGLIRTGTGSGPTSGAMVVTTPTGGMAALLRLQLAAQGFALPDLVATRLLLEEATARALSAQENTALAPAHALLDAMDDQTLSPAAFLALDARFHVTLAEVAGNTVVAATMAGLRWAVEDYVREGAERIRDWPATATRLRSEHRAIVAAIETGDADASAALIRAHITGYYDEARLQRAFGEGG